MVRHRWLNVPVEPVKWRPERCGLATTGSPTSAPSPGNMLMTPGGRPAASNRSTITCAEYVCVGDGFQTTVLPIRAGAAARLAAMDVKLNGLTANTNPSRARYSVRFQMPGDDTGCSA